MIFYFTLFFVKTKLSLISYTLYLDQNIIMKLLQLLFISTFAILSLGIEAQTTKNESITIELIAPQSDTVPCSMRFNMSYKVTNNTTEEIYMPIAMSGSYGEELPGFYNLQTLPGEKCIAIDYPISDDKRDLDTFEKIPANSSKEFKLNPEGLVPGLDCGYKLNDKVKITLKFEPKPEYFDTDFFSYGYHYIKDKELLKEIYSKIPTFSISSQTIEVVTK